MGYRSSVVLAVGKRLVPHFMAALSQEPEARDLVFGYHDNLIKDYDGDGNLLICWDNIKWYEGYPAIDKIGSFISNPLDYGPELDDDVVDHFRFVRIGEEPGDVETDGYGFEIYINQSIDY